MKATLLILFLYLFVVPGSALAGELNEARSIEELSKWAHSSFGGEAREYEYGGNSAVVVIRSYTSGRHSADCTIFTKRDNKWVRTLKRELLLGETIIVKQNGDILTFETNEGRLLMIVPISGLYDRPNGKS